jgi:hypothetical protein
MNFSNRTLCFIILLPYLLKIIPPILDYQDIKYPKYSNHTDKIKPFIFTRNLIYAHFLLKSYLFRDLY